MNWNRRASFFVLILGMVLALAGVCVLVVEASQKPDMNARYVALGSSFAAGIGLGMRAPDSPFACQRSVNGYPQQLARMMGLTLADMTCSGATIKHVLQGGQLFLGPQINTVGPNTELVTLTAGGNDVNYVGDLLAMRHLHRNAFVGFIINQLRLGSRPLEVRPFSQLQSDMVATLQEISHRAPRARVIIVTYPTILPSAGTCVQVGIGEKEAALMRDVETRLTKVTRQAAKAAGVILVDMASLSVGHDACSPVPWVNGASPEHGAAFHPTLAGAEATAHQIARTLNEKH